MREIEVRTESLMEPPAKVAARHSMPAQKMRTSVDRLKECTCEFTRPGA
jgi:hypothetical protein